MPHDDKPLTDEEWLSLQTAQRTLANIASYLQQTGDPQGYTPLANDCAELLADLFAAHEVK